MGLTATGRIEMDLLDLFGGERSETRGGTTTGQDRMQESKTARQKVNEERVFRNIPRQMKASEKLDSMFDE